MGRRSVARVEDTYGHPSHYRPREVVEHRVWDPFLEASESAPARQAVTSNESLGGPRNGVKSPALVSFAEAV